MLAFIEAFLTGGVFDAVLEMAEGAAFPAVITVGALSSVVVALVHLFKSAATLNNFDFCLYMQVVTHFYEKREFTKEDVISWYPINGTCNMHTNKWNCYHMKPNDKCGVNPDDIDWILGSLVDKKILDKHQDEKKLIYKIKG